MRFIKMHGIGNDYVYVDCFRQTVQEPERLAVHISDRHFGVGGDGLILIMPSDKADARMRMFNADGSEAQMCGNGIRCLAKYVYDSGISRKSELTVETLAGNTAPAFIRLQRRCREGESQYGHAPFATAGDPHAWRRRPSAR